MKNMKNKKIFIGCLLFCTLFLMGCDPNAGKRPYNYANTTWVSEEPYIMMKTEKTDEPSYCEMEVNGEIVQVEILFASGTLVAVAPYGSTDDSETYFKGHCKFSKKKCVIKDIEDCKGVLDDSVKEITLIRHNDK